MTKRTHAPLRRTQHVGVLSDGVWSAHDRRAAGSNGAPELFLTRTH